MVTTVVLASTRSDRWISNFQKASGLWEWVVEQFSRKMGNSYQQCRTVLMSDTRIHALWSSFGSVFRMVDSPEIPERYMSTPQPSHPNKGVTYSLIITFALANAVGVYGSKILAVDLNRGLCSDLFASIRR